MLIKIILFFSLVLGANCVERKSMIVKRSGYQDQAVSESGYAYHVDGNGPISYARYSVGDGNLPYERFETPQFVQHSIPLPLIKKRFSPHQHYLGAYDNNLPFNYHHNNHLNSWPPQKPFPYFNYSPYHYHPYDGKYKYARGDRKEYGEAENSAKGVRGESGNKNQQEFEEGSKGKHLKEGHKEHYNKEGGNAANNQNSASYSSRANEAAKGAKGSSFSESKGHKKGSKTTGYHKVYHKDEYKKDHSFYDESDSKGHYENYGKGDTKFEKEAGAAEGGKRSKSEHEQSDYGSKGYLDQGKYLNEDRGNLAKQGVSAYNDNYESYANKDGKQYQDENGYAVSDDEGTV